jgi:hypothetical protein
MEVRTGCEEGRRNPWATLRVKTGDESVVFAGDAGSGEGYVTKVMPLSGGKWFGLMHPSEQVARLLLMRGMADNQDISRIRHLRGVLLEGVPALLIIQEMEQGEEIGSGDINTALKGLSRKTLETLDNVSATNLIRTRNGYKVVDAMLRHEIDGQALERCAKSRTCGCDWYEFVRKTAKGFGKVPEGYAFPEALKKRYAPESNPWIGEVEREILALGRR